MKKPVIFLLILSLCGSLCACRPEILPEGNGTASDLGNSETEPKSETKQDTEQKSLDAEPDAKAEQTAVKDTEKPAEIQQDGIKYFVETKDGVEWKVPEEDPALRAEAEKLRKENRLSECFAFCYNNDILFYNDYSEIDTVIPGKINVYLKRCCSEVGKAFPPFEKYVGPVTVTDIFPVVTVKTDTFRNAYQLIFDSATVEQTVAAAKTIEKVPYVQYVALYKSNEVAYGD